LNIKHVDIAYVLKFRSRKVELRNVTQYTYIIMFCKRYYLSRELSYLSLITKNASYGIMPSRAYLKYVLDLTQKHTIPNS